MLSIQLHREFNSRSGESIIDRIHIGKSLGSSLPFPLKIGLGWSTSSLSLQTDDPYDRLAIWNFPASDNPLAMSKMNPTMLEARDRLNGRHEFRVLQLAGGVLLRFARYPWSDAQQSIASLNLWSQI